MLGVNSHCLRLKSFVDKLLLGFKGIFGDEDRQETFKRKPLFAHKK